jgi:hypothetical protein
MIRVAEQLSVRIQQPEVDRPGIDADPGKPSAFGRSDEGQGYLVVSGHQIRTVDG